MINVQQQMRDEIVQLVYVNVWMDIKRLMQTVNVVSNLFYSIELFILIQII